MGRFIKGDIVVLHFPFSDLSFSKRRPALVLSDLKGDDIIVCQITSQFKKDAGAVSLFAGDFTTGQLKHELHQAKPDIYCRQVYHSIQIRVN